MLYTTQAVIAIKLYHGGTKPYILYIKNISR
nr:MAG TPA: hypothetical protein [Bacteriophage sp.]